MTSLCNIGDILDRARDDINERINDARSRDAKLIMELRNQHKNGTHIFTTPENVVCIIDGVSTPFAARLVALGSTGGATAARKLLKVLKESDCLDDKQITLDVFVFVNSNTMGSHTEEANVRNFCTGFNQADNSLFLIDVGDDDEARVSRIEERIGKAVASSETWKIILGGCDSEAHVPFLEDLAESAKDDMLVVLRTGTTSARMKRLGLSTIRVMNGLFEAGSITTSAAASDGRGGSPGLASILSPPTSPTRTRSLAQVTLAWRSRARSTSDGAALRLDPTIPPWENKPPPCNMFYLLGNCKKESCYCSHDYDVSEDDKLRMRKASKSRPCDSIKYDYPCAFGERCLFGHQCPYGLDCKYLAEGTCWFGSENTYHFDE